MENNIEIQLQTFIHFDVSLFCGIATNVSSENRFLLCSYRKKIRKPQEDFSYLSMQHIIGISSTTAQFLAELSQ
jgi:hypothetical protein